jgi:hypothetical protein
MAPLFEAVEVPVQLFETALARVVADWRTLLCNTGLSTPEGVLA